MANLTWHLVLHRKKYYIIHFDNIIRTEADSREDCVVHFPCKGKYARGTLVLSSNEIDIIATELTEKGVSSENLTLHNNLEEYNWFLVQFESHPKNVSFGVVNNADVVWSTSNAKTLILINGYKTEVLHSSMVQKFVYDKFNSLKSMNFHESFRLSKQHIGPNSPNWILIQYSSGFNNVMYEVIEEKLTECRTDFIAYIKSDRCLYQSKILKRSSCFYEVLRGLEHIRKTLYAKKTNFVCEPTLDFLSLSFDLIDFRLLSFFPQGSINNYFHYDGRSLDFQNEQAKKTEGAQQNLVKIAVNHSENCKVYKWLLASQNS